MASNPSVHVNCRRACTILVVEDDDDLRSAMAFILEQAGYLVTQACNGCDALHSLRRAPHPALIVLDLTMPVMDGWQLHRELQADPGLSTIPVVVVSGWRAGEDAVPVPASRFLQKPFEPDALLALVARWRR